MKKLILSIFSLVLVISINAQDANASYKAAKKAYSKTLTGGDAVADNLAKAAASIDEAIANADQIDEKNRYKAYKLAGDIYNDLANANVQNSFLGQPVDVKINHAIKGYNGYMNAFKSAAKKYQKKESKDGLLSIVSHLDNYGRIYYGEQNFAEAFHSFNTILEAKKVLDAAGEKVILKEDTSYQQHVYTTSLTAVQAEKPDEAKALFITLYELGNAKAGVYENLFKMTSEKDEASAMKYLEEGRAKYPDDEGLRIAEINYYLQKGELDKLTGKLEAAIKKDPKNITLYTTLGYVHDNLFQKANEAGDLDVAQQHFDKAMAQYNKALGLDANSSSVQYSIGALYYNKAAVMTKDLAALESDYSKSGLKKYEAKKAEITGIFDEALPFFLKAETINPKDVSTLIALKEIYARKNDLAKSKEYKARIEEIQAQAGGE